GTLVTLWLPVSEGMPRAAGANEEGSAAAASSGSRARLLLVDDDKLVREMLAQEMQVEGYAVSAAASGAEALALLDVNEKFDVIISDLSMLGMDGTYVIREAQRRCPHLPAILLTGFVAGTAASVPEDARCGTLAVLRKPVEGRALAERVAMLLERGDRRRV
ncbi:MAG: response regulator, partial [Acetobacteraceae bacterium]